MGQVIINGVDLSPYIVNGSYTANIEDVYESFKDGNANEHRVTIASKVRGEFKIACSKKGLTLDSFFEIWNGGVKNKLASLALYVPNLNEIRAVSCYYTITCDEHEAIAGGGFIDILTIKITEK